MKRFGNALQREDKNCDVFQIANRMVRNNQYVIEVQCISNDDGLLAVDDKLMVEKVILRSF